MRAVLRWIAGTFLLIVVATRVSAQELRGTVRDSASGQPIAGAVLTLISSANATLGRNITNERGEFRLALAGVPAQSRLRVLRLGFRPVTIDLPSSGQSIVQREIRMQRIPQMLEPIAARATACPRRSDAGSAMALLEQVRAGLLTAIVGRDSNPAALTRTRYQRVIDMQDKITRFQVRFDSTDAAPVSFKAMRTGAAFVEQGFFIDSLGKQIFLAPDAETLVDDGFIAGYCFQIVRPGRDRPRQVGLGFFPPKEKAGRVDIEGTLWVDTAARELRDLHYTYSGLHRSIRRYDLGGDMSFVELRNGAVLIDRWNIRMISQRGESDEDVARGRVTVDREETGGALARARWPGGFDWEAPLGTLRAKTIRPSSDSSRQFRVRLANTQFETMTTAPGTLEFRHLVPGPYRLEIIDPLLLPIGATIPTALRFDAVRDSVHTATVALRTPQEYVADRCLGRTSVSTTFGTYVLARVVGPDGRPISGVRGTISVEQPDNTWLDATTRTDSAGFLQFCGRQAAIGKPVRVAAAAEGFAEAWREMIVRDTLTVVLVQLGFRR